MAHYSEDLKKEFGYLKQVVSAPLSEALICVDTRDGVKYNSTTGLISSPNNPYDIQIYPTTSLFAGAVRRIKMKEIVIPWNIPNVNARNNVLYLENEDGTTRFTVVVEEQFYTPVALATYIQTYLRDNNALGFALWAVGWDDTNNNFTIQGNTTPGSKFRILPKNNQNLPPPLTDTLATMMGFQNVPAGYANNASGSFALMNYTQYVDVVSPFITKNQYVIDRSTNFKTGNSLIARLYIAPDMLYPINDTGSNIIGTRPFVYHKEFMVPKEINWDMDESLPSINIQLRDDKGDILYVPPGGFSSDLSSSVASNSSYVAITFGVSEARGE
jgi:hypothetical protein